MLKYQWCYEMMYEWKVLNWFKVSESVLQLGFKLCKEKWWKFHVDWFNVFEESMICKE